MSNERKQEIIELLALLELIEAGNAAAMIELWERLYGKTKQ